MLYEEDSMKRIGLMQVICVSVLLMLVGCSSAEQEENTVANAEGTGASTTVEKGAKNEDSKEHEKKILNIGVQYSPSSLDTHKGYSGWHTSTYGITETLFKVGDDFSLEPLLAESGSADGLVWTILLKDNVQFSNGDALVADMVVRNIMRVAAENPRFAYLADFTYEVVDDKTFTIASETPFPTMLNTLSSCEMGMLHLDKITDFDNGIIATGPFVVEAFESQEKTTLLRNENYWDGDVVLHKAVFYRIPDPDTLLMAMQNGEIDCYNGVNAAAMEIFSADPSAYNLVTVPATRLQMYFLNQERLNDKVRAAINLTVNPEDIVSYLGGTVSATAGPFSASSAYGKVHKPSVDTEAAITLLEEDGYVRNSGGYFEKDGKVLEVNIAYYPGRSLDVLATIMQEQLKHIGIQSVLTSEEKPDSTYIATRDFDIALYSMNADLSGDPAYFITNTLKDGAYYDVAGFDNADCEALITKLTSEMDTAKRAELANQIIQITIDDNAFGYVAIFNKSTVLSSGVSGFAETSPFDFYGIDAKTDKE